MKFAHLADTHLGYRQYGLFEREKDFYEVFDKVIDKIIEENVDFVIHSGDLFETAKPSPMALLNFQKGLLKLKGAGIPMYAIAGNHDVVIRQGDIPPQVIFKRSGLKLISKINPTYMHGDIFIAGIPYYPASHDRVLKNQLSDLSKKAAGHEKSILLMHQGIDQFLGQQYELEIGDIPDNFNYYALGHIHRFINTDFGNGKLVYPGSSEIWRSDEVKDFKQNGKGFVIVDMDGPKPLVKRVKIDIQREFIDRTIDYNDLESGIASIKELIKDFDKKPIINLTVVNVDSDTSFIYEIINEELGDLALMIRPIFKMLDDVLMEVESDENGDKVGPLDLVDKALEGYGNDQVNKLAKDLYEYLSKDKLDESQELLSEFFQDFYKNEMDEMEFKTEEIKKEEIKKEETPKEEPDVQITFKEVLE